MKRILKSYKSKFEQHDTIIVIKGDKTFSGTFHSISERPIFCKGGACYIIDTITIVTDNKIRRAINRRQDFLIEAQLAKIVLTEKFKKVKPWRTKKWN